MIWAGRPSRGSTLGVYKARATDLGSVYALTCQQPASQPASQPAASQPASQPAASQARVGQPVQIAEINIVARHFNGFLQQTSTVATQIQCGTFW